MSNELASLEAEQKEYIAQLELVQSGIQADPSNAELQTLKTELEEVISLTSSAIAELKPASAATSVPASSIKYKPTNINSNKHANPSPEPEKWSKANHPAYQAGYKPPHSPTLTQQQDEAEKEKPTFSVNDSVLAKWKSGDRGFYPARITSITGSSANPVYIVTFKSYATTETLSLAEIKPLSSSNPNKRKDPPAASSPTSTAAGGVGGGGGVISKTSTVDSSLLPTSEEKKEPSKVSDGPARPAKIPRKVKANKELEAGKNKWQQFSAGGVGVKKKAGSAGLGLGGKKESMFRTGEGVNARVGFTGSGKEMRKDEKRARHVYSAGGGEEEEY